jgi:hypothetical protein
MKKKNKASMEFSKEMDLMRKAQRMNPDNQDKTYFFGEVGRSRPKNKR